jgi:hypothetical protein
MAHQVVIPHENGQVIDDVMAGHADQQIQLGICQPERVGGLVRC